VRWSLRALTLAAVALTAIMGGQRYLYCRAMDEIMTEATCDCSKSHSNENGADAISVLNDCFEVRYLSRLVTFTVGDELMVPPASLLTTLAVPAVEVPPPNAVLTAAEHPIRAGPLSPAASRSQLMVFLT
jgi:hypothetical protein